MCLPGLVAVTALASGAVALIYNLVALATVYGAQAKAFSAKGAKGSEDKKAAAAQSGIPLVLVVDDSITVRRVTQHLLQREGYRVALAAGGLQGISSIIKSLFSSALLSSNETSISASLCKNVSSFSINSS